MLSQDDLIAWLRDFSQRIDPEDLVILTYFMNNYNDLVRQAYQTGYLDGRTVQIDGTN